MAIAQLALEDTLRLKGTTIAMGNRAHLVLDGKWKDESV